LIQRCRFCSIVTNAFVHIIAAITAYQINPFKPKRNLQPSCQLETTV
jgi:hypothetical protein